MWAASAPPAAQWGALIGTDQMHDLFRITGRDQKLSTDAASPSQVARW